MRSLVLLAALLVPATAFAAVSVEDDLTTGLRAPGVSAVVVLFKGVGPSAERFNRDAAIALRDQYGARGVVVWVVTGTLPREACTPAGLYDVRLICDGTPWRSAFGVAPRQSQAFVWSWTGQLLARNIPIDGIGERLDQARAKAARVALMVQGSSDPEGLRESIRSALLEDHKVHPFDRRTETAWLSSVRFPAVSAPCGPQHSHSDAILRITQTKTRLDAMLFDPNQRCVVARIAAPLRSFQKIATALANELASRPVLPSRAIATAPIPNGPDIERTEDDDVEPDTGMALRAEAKAWVGVPYKRWGKDHRGVDDDQLVRQIVRSALGRDAGLNRREMLNRGDEIAVDANHPERGLEAGDLIFVMSGQFRARWVGVYLGRGEWIHTTKARGVLIDRVPKDPPKGTWLAARRDR